MNTHEEIWETIQNEVAYLNGGSLDARKGSLAEQAANALTPFVEDLLRETQAEAWSEGFLKGGAYNEWFVSWGEIENPYRKDAYNA